MAKGDKVTVYLRGVADGLDVEATKAGRKLVTEFDKDANIQWFLVHEKTWTDKIVKTARFNAVDVVAISTNFEEES